VRKCSRKVYKHDTLGQGRTVLLLLTLVQLPPEEEYWLLGHCRGARETSGNKNSTRSAADAHAATATEETRSIFRAQAQVRRPRAIGVSHPCTTPRLHPSIFRHRTASDKEGGGQGINHGKETRPRATACSKTAVRVSTSHTRESRVPAQADPRVEVQAAFSPFASLFCPPLLQARRQTWCPATKRRGTMAERQSQKNKHRQTQAAEHVHANALARKHGGRRKEKREKRPSAISGRVRQESADERAQGAPCANAQGKSTNTTLWGKGGRCCSSSHWYNSLLPKKSTGC
jgi:hypothetical protein